MPAEGMDAHVGGQLVTSGDFEHLALRGDVWGADPQFLLCFYTDVHCRPTFSNCWWILFLLTSHRCAFDHCVYFYSLSLSLRNKTNTPHKETTILQNGNVEEKSILLSGSQDYLRCLTSTLWKKKKWYYFHLCFLCVTDFTARLKHNRQHITV